MPLLYPSRLRSSALLDGSSVHFPAVTYLEDCHYTLLIVNQIYDAIIALTNPVPVVIPCELFGAARARVLRQRLDLCNDSLAVGLGTHRLKLLPGGRLDG